MPSGDCRFTLRTDNWHHCQEKGQMKTNESICCIEIPPRPPVIIADDSGSYEIHPDGSVTERSGEFADGGLITYASARTVALEMRADQGLTPLQVRFCDYVLGPDPISAAVREFVKLTRSLGERKVSREKAQTALELAWDAVVRMESFRESAWEKLTDQEKKENPL